jgi:peptidoglycan-associated lipoprotein
MHRICAGIFVFALLAGCSSTPTPESGVPVEERTPMGAAGATGATTSGTTGGGIAGNATQGGMSAAALKDPNNILSKRSVYFDYDSFVVKDEYKAMLEAHAKYLQANRNTRVTLQGHADERGSREYNIALGQKRADAVKKLMQLLGATEIQIETVSFGKEKPKNLGHDETAWAENRRVDVYYVGE